MIERKKLLAYFKAFRLPTIYCPGCGIGLALKAMLSAFYQLGMNWKNTAVISGIGCAARAPGYLNMDTINAIHGRALPIAEGLKTVRPKLNVVVFSGDGDLLSIGGNHLLHLLRRQTKITVIMINNQIYGLTGGQSSPTTPQGVKTPTTPQGNFCQPIKAEKIITSFPSYFYAKSSCYHLDHLEKVIVEALKWPKFSFVEVISPCPTNFYRYLGFKTPFAVYQNLSKKYTFATSGQKELKENQLGVLKSNEKRNEN